MSADVAYLDSSALVKTLVLEPGSGSLRRWLGRRPLTASSALVRVEVVRALRPQGPAAVLRARRAFSALTLIGLDDELLDAAAELEPAVRSLDAIHLASALSLGDDLGPLVTYDSRMAAAAELLGLEVVAP